MISGRENKIEMTDVQKNWKVSEFKQRIFEILPQHNVTAPNSWNLIRILYSGRILNDTQVLDKVLPTNLEPPFTMQIMFRSEDSNPNPSESNNEKSGCIIQ